MGRTEQNEQHKTEPQFSATAGCKAPNGRAGSSPARSVLQRHAQKKRLKLPGGVCSHEARSSWMLISLSRWVFLLFKPDPIFPLRISNLCKDLERVLAQVAPGSTGQEHPTLAGIAASQAHLSSQGHNSRFCHCHREGLPHRQEI